MSPTKLRKPVRSVLVASVVVVGTSFIGIGLAAAVGSDDEPRTPPGDAAALLDGRTDAERARDLAHQPDDVRDGMAKFEEDLSANRIPVGDRTGLVGYIESSALGRRITSEADLAPVYDDAGAVVAYFGAQMGVVPKDLVDAPGAMDVDAWRDARTFEGS